MSRISLSSASLAEKNALNVGIVSRKLKALVSYRNLCTDENMKLEHKDNEITAQSAGSIQRDSPHQFLGSTPGRGHRPAGYTCRRTV
jgi:hypothetical protein